MSQNELNEQQHGWISWISSYWTSESLPQSQLPGKEESKEQLNLKELNTKPDSTDMASIIDPNNTLTLSMLPQLPFQYNPNLCHLIYYEDADEDEYFVVQLTDLDYQFLTYFSSFLNVCVVYDMGNKKLCLKNLLVNLFKRNLSSSDPTYQNVCDFLKIDKIYAYIGNSSALSTLSCWFDSLYSSDMTTNTLIEKTRNDAFIHGKCWYPDFFY